MYSEANLLEKATPTTKALYYKLKQDILSIGDDVSFKPTKKHISLWKNSRRIANFTINMQSFKIWINVPPGLLDDPARLTTITKEAHTINVNREDQFQDVLNWLKQAHKRR